MPRATVRPLDADRPSAASHAPAQWQELRTPVGVFDAGIGSYAVARLIQQRYPWQDVIYLADRASFPYGGKTHAELGRVVGAAIARLADWGARAVVLASNAPSVMVLQELQAFSPVPVLGVYPPVRQALALSRSGEVALLGVASLVSSPQIAAYVQREAAGRAVRVVNASALVALVESGAFLSDAAGTQTQVHAFMQALLRQHPGVDVCTLSSTHLPWLRAFFEQAAPQVQFLDPAQSVVERLAALLPQLDWVGLDIKAPAHRHDAITATSGSAGRPRQALRALADSGIDFECRTTWHPGLFSASELLALADELRASGVTCWAVQECRTPAAPAWTLTPEQIRQLGAGFERFTLRRA